MRRSRYEVSTVGIDESLQGLTSDFPGLVDKQPFPLSTGLRIPPILPGDTGPANRPRYLFLLATKVATKPWLLRGIRQGLNIGFNGGAALAQYPLELPVVTPTWRFPDGNVSWHLVWEPNRSRVQQRPKSDGASLAFVEAETPALVYQSYTNTNGSPPPYYNVGLTAYKPPTYVADWRPINGLGCFYDIRYPWGAPANSLNVLIDGNARVSLYASVLQSDVSTRPALISGLPTFSEFGASPEDRFVATPSVGGAAVNPIYWRVYGSLLCEDSPGEQDETLEQEKRHA